MYVGSRSLAFIALGFDKTLLFRLYLCRKTLIFKNSNFVFRTYVEDPDGWFAVTLHFLHQNGFFGGTFHISEPSKLTEVSFSCNIKIHFEICLWYCVECLSFSSSKSKGWEMNWDTPVSKSKVQRRYLVWYLILGFHRQSSNKFVAYNKTKTQDKRKLL